MNHLLEDERPKCEYTDNPALDMSQICRCGTCNRYLVKLLKQSDELSAARERIAELEKSLALMYDRWENGDDVYVNPDELEGFLGKAIRLSFEEENEILRLLESVPRSVPSPPAESEKP